jgi:hypothetical protein
MLSAETSAISERSRDVADGNNTPKVNTATKRTRAVVRIIIMVFTRKASDFLTREIRSEP